MWKALPSHHHWNLYLLLNGLVGLELQLEVGKYKWGYHWMLDSHGQRRLPHSKFLHPHW
jgi:hypothetical protein